MRSWLLAMWFCAFALPACAQRGDEIGQLLAAVRVSACGFERDGTMFSGAAAAEHLALKIQRAPAESTATAERFIERVGSGSSLNGRPYRIHCPGEVARDTNGWLKEQLQRIRRANAGARQVRAG